MTIEVDDEIAERLSEEALRRGKSPDDVASEVLLAGLLAATNGKGVHNVMEFAGIGAGRPWSLQGRDGQEYVNEMRDEWTEREGSFRP